MIGLLLRNSRRYDACFARAATVGRCWVVQANNVGDMIVREVNVHRCLFCLFFSKARSKDCCNQVGRGRR